MLVNRVLVSAVSAVLLAGLTFATVEASGSRVESAESGLKVRSSEPGTSRPESNDELQLIREQREAMADRASRSVARNHIHVVRRGETLAKIARAEGLSAWEPIYWANAKRLGKNPHNLRTGQRLVIPTSNLKFKPVPYQAPARDVSSAGSSDQPTVSYGGGGAKAIAQSMLAARGWSGQWSCLESLWERESGWNVTATNPSSGAYGIPQSLPGSKMATAGSDWQTNPATQISWGLSYIQGRYGTPCGAWNAFLSKGWY